ncbi:MAG: hypothetical protein ACREQR_18015 [Candidatus Binataceae bacterium]
MSNLRYLARSLAFLPPIVLLSGLLIVASCGKSPYSTSNSSTTASPTSTSTATGGGFAFVTNFSSGFITEFKRNISTGVLKYNTRIAAGAASGPKGIAITSNNAFLYASNTKDDTIYQYTVGSDGTLTPMTPPSVPNGSGTAPEQVVTLSIGGTPAWLFVANSGTGSISAYPITSAGPLGKAFTSTPAGMNSPFGLAINAAGTILYVSDNQQGVIYALAFNSTSGALTNITTGLPPSPVKSLGSITGFPGFLALGPLITGTIPGNYLLVGDTSQTTPVISLFFIASSGNGVPGFTTTATPTSFAAIGVAWAGSALALSANQNTTGDTAAGSINSYTLSSNALSNSSNVLEVNGPTDIIVDSQVANAYSTDQGDGTISQYQFNIVCQSGGTVQTICRTATLPSDPKISNPGPFGMVLTN